TDLFSTMTHPKKQFMQASLKLAQTAKEKGNTPVGCTIVQNDQIIAKAMESEDSLPGIMGHAENLALLKAVKKLNTHDLSDCVLYTTVEPCFMCTYLIRQLNVGEVIYGTATPAGGHSSPYPILLAEDIKPWKKAPKVISGYMKKACEAMFKKTNS